ncbi:uncharacterized protein B0I36DRAFT_332628, partial [Microdochium trichocladiopsis]
MKVSADDSRDRPGKEDAMRMAVKWLDFAAALIQILVKMAVPLFIFADTVCRFLAVRKCGNPDKKL